MVAFVITTSVAWADFKIVNTVPPGVDAADPLFQLGYLDVTKAPYFADPSGGSDSTAALQKAVEDGRDHQLVVFLPSGTYKVSDTIHMVMLKDSMGHSAGREFPTHILGSKGTRPKIVLANNSPKFGVGTKRAVLFFQAVDPQDGSNNLCGTADAPPPPKCFDPDTTTNASDNFNQTLRNVEVVVGTGNPGAIGVRMGSAQGAVLEDVVIDARGGFAGIYDAPGMGGGTYNVSVTGGEYGAYITTESRFLMMAGCKFKNQTRAGIHYMHSQPIVLAGCRFDMPNGAKGFELHADTDIGRYAQAASVTMVDTVFKMVSNHVAIWNPDLGNIYLKNVSVSSGAVAVQNGAASWKAVGNTRIDEYAYTDPVGAINLIDGVFSGAENKVISPITALPTYDSVRKLHTWVPGSLPSFEDADVVNAKDFGVLGDGRTDDTTALQNLIQTQDKIFLPKGVYKIRNIKLRENTQLFGVARYITSLYGLDSTTAQRELVSTVDSAIGKGSISFMHLLQSKKDLPGYHPLVWRLGRNSMVHAVTADDFESGPLQTNTKSFWVTGSGGGRWYGAQEDLTQISGDPGFRSFYVSGTTEPLSIYSFSAERLDNEPMAEVVNAKNVRLFYFKTESGMHPDKDTGIYLYMIPLRIANSTNVALFAMHGNVNLADQKAMVDVQDSSDVLLTQVRTQYGKASPDFNSVNETIGAVVNSVPSDLLCNVCKVGAYWW